MIGEMSEQDKRLIRKYARKIVALVEESGLLMQERRFGSLPARSLVRHVDGYLLDSLRIIAEGLHDDSNIYWEPDTDDDGQTLSLSSEAIA